MIFHRRSLYNFYPQLNMDIHNSITDIHNSIMEIHNSVMDIIP